MNTRIYTFIKILGVLMVLILVSSVVVAITILNSPSKPVDELAHCEQPLVIGTKIVKPDNFDMYLTDNMFRDVVNSAVDEWELRTHLDLFTVLDKNDPLNRSGLFNPVVATPRTSATIQQKSYSNIEILGTTFTETNPKGTVADFKVEIYNLDPDTIRETVLHELGHARGLSHSQDRADIMYPYEFDNQSSHDLTPNDVNAMINFCNSK